jgi:hypothetical protein
MYFDEKTGKWKYFRPNPVSSSYWIIKEYDQPERLNPEDHIEHNLEMICDSPNSENK